MPEPVCQPRIRQVTVAHIGRRYQMICSCGAKSPVASREVAQLAYDSHTGAR